jgi:hypothetical protein
MSPAQRPKEPVIPPQRSTRAPAEGADPDSAPEYDHAEADHGGAPLQRSTRAPAEGPAERDAARDLPDAADTARRSRP